MAYGILVTCLNISTLCSLDLFWVHNIHFHLFTDTPDMYTVSVLFSPGLLTGSDTIHSMTLCCPCLRQSVIWVGWPPAPTNRARDCHTTVVTEKECFAMCIWGVGSCKTGWKPRGVLMGRTCQQEATGICAHQIRLAWYALCPRFVKENNRFVSNKWMS